MNIFFQSIITSAASFVVVRPIFFRERLSNLYSSSSFYIGLIIADMPWNTLMVILFTIVSYFAYQLDVDSSKFFIHFLICLITYYAGSAFGNFWGVIISDF